MTSKEEQQQQKKKRQQQDLDSILDAALDELEEDSDDDNNSNDDEENNIALNQNLDDGSGPSEPEAAATAVTMGVPYSLEYLAKNPLKAAATYNISCDENRPKFGPEPPPPQPSSPPPPSVDDGGKKATLAASLESMMKQFASGLDSSANGLDFNNENDPNMKDLEHAEKALEEMFQKMMMMEGNGAGGGGGMSMPSTSSNTTAAAADAGGKSKKSSSKSSSNGKSSKNNNNNNIISNKESKNEKKEPNVDESINRLLDGISQASSTQQQQQFNNGIPPNIDPSQLEHLSEQMMGSLMNDFEQFNTSHDSNDVVDSVMKQLLDKELMYEPMKEVCIRYPKWLASNKDRLSSEEYQKYGTQYQYFQRIVRLYETDPGNFDRLMELMQDIQEYGQPPVEIIKELAPELQFDEEGMPIMDPMAGGMGGGGMMPGMPFPMGGPNGEQCCIS